MQCQRRWLAEDTNRKKFIALSVEVDRESRGQEVTSTLRLGSTTLAPSMSLWEINSPDELKLEPPSTGELVERRPIEVVDYYATLERSDSPLPPPLVITAQDLDVREERLETYSILTVLL